MPADCTIVIAARNAAATIARAVGSARADGCARLLLVDHASTDSTVEAARSAGGSALDVVPAPAEARLGRVRQLGLEAVATEFGMWLDADDEIVSGRTTRLMGRLREAVADLAYDEVDLHDGATGRKVRTLPIPPFLTETQIAREFERNFLASVGFPAFRTASARAIGFDPDMHGAEDVDFLLRAIVAEQRVVLVREVGYRQYAYPQSLSRDVKNQKQMVGIALRKHDPAGVRRLFEQAGYDRESTVEFMVTFLTMRGDLALALSGVAELPIGHRRDFREGTLLAALGRHQQARGPLERAAHDAPSAEVLNNLGVVLAALGQERESAQLFQRALRMFPGYADAAANAAAELASRLTLLPLREEPVRDDYR